jgi:hypothetical protein
MGMHFLHSWDRTTSHGSEWENRFRYETKDARTNYDRSVDCPDKPTSKKGLGWIFIQIPLGPQGRKKSYILLPIITIVFIIFMSNYTLD